MAVKKKRKTKKPALWGEGGGLGLVPMAELTREELQARYPTKPAYNHTRGDSALTPCPECAAHPGHVSEGGR